MRQVEAFQLAKIQVGQAVAVGQVEVFAFDVALDALHPAAGHRVQAGFHQRDAPIFAGRAVVYFHPVGGVQLDGEVAVVEAVVEEKALDEPALVAQAEDEIPVSAGGVAFHDVPEDGPAADGQHGLGQVLGHVADTRALPAAKKDDLHARLRPWQYPHLPLCAE